MFVTRKPQSLDCSNCFRCFA